jgi:hypothetical protein
LGTREQISCRLNSLVIDGVIQAGEFLVDFTNVRSAGGDGDHHDFQPICGFEKLSIVYREPARLVAEKPPRADEFGRVALESDS